MNLVCSLETKFLNRLITELIPIVSKVKRSDCMVFNERLGGSSEELGASYEIKMLALKHLYITAWNSRNLCTTHRIVKNLEMVNF